MGIFFYESQDFPLKQVRSGTFPRRLHLHALDNPRGQGDTLRSKCNQTEFEGFFSLSLFLVFIYD